MPVGAIIHVVQHLRPGGLEVMALELARAQARTVPTFVLSLEGTRAAAEQAWPRLREQSAQLLFLGKRPGLDGRLWIDLAHRFTKFEPRCVHTHHAGPLLYAGVAARLAGVRNRIHTEHDAWHLADARRRRLVQAALLIARPVLVADAPHVAGAVQQAIGGRLPRVILNGIDTDRFCPADRLIVRRALGLPHDAPVIGVAARLEHVKGVDIALEAFARLGMSATLAVAGDGSEREALENQAERLGIAKRVVFLGRVDAMPAFFSALDVFCLPSRAEGLPLSILEAQSCGVFVVASDVGGVAAGLSVQASMAVPPEQPERLASALRQALREVRERPDVAQDARDFVMRNASLERASNAYLELAIR